MELPVSVVKRTHMSSFKPPRNAVEVESMVTHSPGNIALFTSCRLLVSLAVYTGVRNVCSANSTVLDFNVPSPHSYCVPLLNFEPFDCFHLYLVLNRVFLGKVPNEFFFFSFAFLLDAFDFSGLLDLLGVEPVGFS